MDDTSPVMHMPTTALGQPQAPPWQPERPALVYDPASHSGARVSGIVCRMPVIWLCATTFGAMVGGALAVTNPQVYSAAGLLLGLGADEIAAQDERAILRSDQVMRGIADRVGVRRIAPDCAAEKASAACAASRVSAQMQVRIAGDPSGSEGRPMLWLTATHADPAIAIAMVDAAVAIDRTIWHEARRANRASTLDPQLDAAQSVLDQTMAAAARIRAQAHVTTIAQDVAQAAAETNAIARQDADLRLRQAALGAELNAVQNTLQRMPETVLDSREVSSGDPGQDSRALLLQLKLQRAHMSQLYAPDYPGLAELSHKIEAVEAAMKIQAKSTTLVTRDIRNPILAALLTKTAALGAESAGLAQQRQELQHQWAAASTREADLRGAEQLLSTLQQRQGTQAAVVRQLVLSQANLRAEDDLTIGRLAQHRLLQRPEAVAVLWTGLPAASAAGIAACLLYGIGLSILAWRQRAFRGAVPMSRRALERSWRAPAVAAAPQVMAVPLPSRFERPRPPAPIPPGIGRLAQSLEQAASLRMFAVRRDRDIKSLGFDDQCHRL